MGWTIDCGSVGGVSAVVDGGNTMTGQVLNCAKCEGSGRACGGVCFRCGGKGYQSIPDHVRNTRFDKRRRMQQAVQGSLFRKDSPC